jgi:hypothetical protein
VCKCIRHTRASTDSATDPVLLKYTCRLIETALKGYDSRLSSIQDFFCFAKHESLIRYTKLFVMAPHSNNFDYFFINKNLIH